MSRQHSQRSVSDNQTPLTPLQHTQLARRNIVTSRQNDNKFTAYQYRERAGRWPRVKRHSGQHFQPTRFGLYLVPRSFH
ncbi:hypothetical protein WG68_16095 [Arsukibacterium ikkense]|uniref:Uncharacterized protein n=1 Tax=Arsukibacterium ikkense TaxID=336831 RepID=A0A0M2V154_9GAMM|nr:hypothetical protein WG68_16095 [Arsukibacterium ikkense]